MGARQSNEAHSQDDGCKGWTVRELALWLIRHGLRGRGNDVVVVYLLDLPDDLNNAVQLRANWVVAGMDSYGRDDPWVRLDAKASPVRDSHADEAVPQ